MNSKKTTMPPGLDWLELQKNYLDACRVFSQCMPGMEGSARPYANPVADAAESWWRSVAPSLPEGNAEYINKIIEQSKIYYFLGDQFIKMLNMADKTGNAVSDWDKIINTQMEEMKTAFGKMQNDAKEVAHKMAGVWQLMPMDTLQRTLSLGSLMPGDFLSAFKHDDMQKMSDKFLSIPGVGYTRESQEQFQEGIRLLNEYQKVSREYNQAISNVGIQALEAMRQKILDMSKEGKELKTLREVYDLWVDCSEQAYATFAYTPEHSRLYGRLANTLMAVKQHGRNIIDEGLGALNAPTQKGINTLQKRQYDMGRQQKAALKIIQELQQEIADLHNQLQQSGTGKGDAPSAPAAKRKISKTNVVSINKKRKAKTGAIVSRKKKIQQGRKDKMIVIKI